MTHGQKNIKLYIFTSRHNNNSQQ